MTDSTPAAGKVSARPGPDLDALGAQGQELAEMYRQRGAMLVVAAGEAVKLRARIEEVEAQVAEERSQYAELLRMAKDMAAELERTREQRDAAQRKVHAAERIHTWKNEEGKRFVFVDDLAKALEVPGADKGEWL